MHETYNYAKNKAKNISKVSLPVVKEFVHETLSYYYAENDAKNNINIGDKSFYVTYRKPFLKTSLLCRGQKI